MVSTLSPVLWATLPICIDCSLIISINSGVYSRVKREMNSDPESLGLKSTAMEGLLARKSILDRMRGPRNMTNVAGIEVPSTSPIFLTIVAIHILLGLACIITGAVVCA
jgi:hypothetical protein